MSADTQASSASLAASAADEWAHLVTAAVLGTDRRPLPLAPAGWDRVRRVDAAVELLDRAAAVATSRRAGVEPGARPAMIAPAPLDARPLCSPAASVILGRLLRGDHDIVLPEWFDRCATAGVQPPPHLVPTLLLRGRRFPAFDAAVRRAVGPRAAWLAEAMPELRIAATTSHAAVGADGFARPPQPVDSGAVVTAIAGAFIERAATWAAVAQMRVAVAALDPAWLAALVLELNRAPFHAHTERTRVDLLGLAQLRQEMIVALPEAH